MFEKWDAAVSLAKDPQHKFAKCAVDRAKEVVVAAAEKCPVKESLLAALEGLQVEEADVEGELKSRVEASVAKNEAAMVGALREHMSRWTAIREEEVIGGFRSMSLSADFAHTTLIKLHSSAPVQTPLWP